MMLSNRSKGVSPPGSSAAGITKVDCFGLLIEVSACLVLDECEEAVRVPGQLLVGQASASGARHDFREAASVSTAMLAFVIAERLLVQVSEQVKRLDRNVSAFQATLKQGPEVLNPIGMYVAFNVLFGVIHKLMNIVFLKAGVRRQFVGEHFGTRFNIRPHFFLQCAALAIGYVLDADLTSLAIQQAHYQFFARATGARYFFCFLILVHEAGESADHGLIGFDRTAAAEFLESTALHSESNTMEHKPCGFLADSQIACNFTRTDPVLAIADEPDSGQPLSQRQRRILENRSDLHTELSPIMLRTALPAPLIGEKMNLVASADRAFHDAVGPATRGHVSDTTVFVREIPNRIRQVLRDVIIRFHILNLTQTGGLVKSIFTKIRDFLAKYSRPMNKHTLGYWVLDRHQFALGITHERVELPRKSKIAARVEGRSTLARLGLVIHMTAPTIHCGFAGNIVLEMYNFGPNPLRLGPGLEVCQLVLERVGKEPTAELATTFMNQASVVRKPS
jgi:deoxycytidine triphosphate deaminase